MRPQLKLHFKRVLSVASFTRLGKHVLVLLMLSACSPPSLPEQTFASYQAQLSQELEQQPVQIKLQPMPVMPRSSTLRNPIEEKSISLFDSMRLDRCRAGALIAERNSALGRLRSPSARLYYEIDLMQALHECRQSAVADNERMDTALAEAITHKKEVLPQWIARVLTNSDELRHALRAHSSPLAQQQAPDAKNVLAALAYLTETFEQLNAEPSAIIDLEPYKTHFRTLHQSDYLPRFWRTQQHAAAWMQALNQQLEQAIQDSTCRDQVGLEGLFEHYQQNIQPLLIEWWTTHNKLKGHLVRLRELSPQESWQDYLNELIGKSSHAQKLHNEKIVHKLKWNKLFTKSCSNNSQTAYATSFLL